jgi:polyisoprenoid-binding protein YceI
MLVALRSAAVAAAVLVGSSLAAQDAKPMDRVWFTGASNLRSFVCRTRSVGKAIDLQDYTRAAALLAGDRVVTSARIEIPSRSLHCGIAQMNRHLRHTLRADEHPLIRFEMRGYDVVPGDTAAAVRMEGALEVAGVERPISLTGTLRRDAGGSLHLVGRHPVRPSEFGVHPPRRFLGLLRVRDEVMVHFDVAIAPPEPLALLDHHRGVPGCGP